MFLLFTLIGFLPFVFGGIMNWFMMTYQNVLPPYMFISVGTLLFWFATVYFTRPYATSAKQLLCGIHLVPFVVIVMLFIQEIILNAYWRNFIGQWTQLYYLPLLHFGFLLTSWSHRIFTAYLMAFVMMVLAALGGCCLRRKIN